MNSAYLHDDNECFCIECGNNSLNAEHEMCEKCYDIIIATIIIII